MDIKTFMAIKEIEKMAKQYNEKAESSEGDLKGIYENIVNDLDVLYDKALRIGKYSDEEDQDLEGVMKQSINGIPSYAKVQIIKTFHNQNCIVIDTSGELFLVPIDTVNIIKN